MVVTVEAVWKKTCRFNQLLPISEILLTNVMSRGSEPKLVLRTKSPRDTAKVLLSLWFRAVSLCRSGKETQISSPYTVRIWRQTTSFFSLSALRHSDRRMPAKLAHLLVCIPENLAYLSIKKHLTQMLLQCLT